MLTNKIVFITGGASGLGKILVETAIQNEAKVFFTYRKSVEKAKELVERHGNNVFAYEADASDYTAAEAAVGKCIEVYGTIDVLINNAGLF